MIDPKSWPRGGHDSLLLYREFWYAECLQINKQGEEEIFSCIGAHCKIWDASAAVTENISKKRYSAALLTIADG